MMCCVQLVVLMDPTDENDDILRQNRSREKQFMFDLALDGQTTQVRPPVLGHRHEILTVILTLTATPTLTSI